jgi:hypothetical protein
MIRKAVGSKEKRETRRAEVLSQNEKREAWRDQRSAKTRNEKPSVLNAQPKRETRSQACSTLSQNEK